MEYVYLIIILAIIFIKKYKQFINFNKIKHFYINLFYFKKINKKKKEIMDKILKEAKNKDPKDIIINKLPLNGYNSDMLINMCNKWSIEERNKYINKMSGTLYKYDDILLDKLSFIFKKYAYTNPLHPDIYPSLRKMESEIVSMACDIFNLNTKDRCGCLTIGGTESILLAIKTYRDYWYNNSYFTNFRKPNIVVPISIHAAFQKGCELMNIEIRYAKLEKNKYCVDIIDMYNLIDNNTIMLAASSPCYPYGIIDPIEKISKIAISKKIGFHVDACLGGMILGLNNFYEDKIKFDFICEGVSSLSVDTHKYGFTPKGSSILLFRNRDLRKYQYSLNVNWTGGIYATPTLLGSRPGYTIAFTWFTLLYYGKKKYIEYSNLIINRCNELKNIIKNINELIILGNPKLNIISFKNNEKYLSKNRFFKILDILSKENWSLNILQNPMSVHICITIDNINNCNNLFDRFKQLFVETKENLDVDNESDMASIYGMSSIVSSNHIEDVAISFLDSLTYN